MGNFLRYITVVFTLTMTASFISCREETINPVDVGYDYFPSAPGHWAVYETDSAFYDGFHHIVRISHFITKDSIESTFIDNSGRSAQRIERYIKYDSMPFFLKEVYSSNLTSLTAEKTEDNNRIIKLVFPVREDQVWNGNAKNTLGEQEYKYEKIFEPFTVNGISFDSTVTVINCKDSNLIFVKIQFEVYAKNVGLIYKKYRDVKKFPDAANDSVISGVDYSYRIIGYGK